MTKYPVITIFLASILICCSAVRAQDLRTPRIVSPQSEGPASQYLHPNADSLREADVSLLPTLWIPEPQGYISPWKLHSGLNAQLGMDISIAFGRHSGSMPVGIGTTAAIAYAMPLSERISAAGGLITRSLDFGSWRERRLSVFGMATYRLNDFVNISAFGSRTVMPKGYPRHYLPSSEETWGGAAEFSLGRGAFLQIGVSGSRENF